MTPAAAVKGECPERLPPGVRACPARQTASACRAEDAGRRATPTRAAKHAAPCASAPMSTRSAPCALVHRPGYGTTQVRTELTRASPNDRSGASSVPASQPRLARLTGGYLRTGRGPAPVIKRDPLGLTCGQIAHSARKLELGGRVPGLGDRGVGLLVRDGPERDAVGLEML